MAKGGLRERHACLHGRPRDDMPRERDIRLTAAEAPWLWRRRSAQRASFAWTQTHLQSSTPTLATCEGRPLCS